MTADDSLPDATPPEVALDEPPEVELLALADGLPDLIDTDEGLEAYAKLLAAGTGPVGIDAERASGYRYSNRAYLIQLRRAGAGTALVDPISLSSLDPLQDALEGTEWILHAATQDLPCLTELGLFPTHLFDTELAGRLLGLPRVGLATLVETIVGFRMKKEHSAADWSTRPLPLPWLEYAALDVEVLVELRDALDAQLEEAGKSEWARQEFDYLRGFEAAVRVDPWRRTSGMHRVRGRRGLGVVKGLWEARDTIAQQRDVSPGRIMPDSAIVAAAMAMPADRRALLDTKGFHGRGAERYANTWLRVLRETEALDEEDLPAKSPRSDAPPAPRAWADKSPVAARRLSQARTQITELAEQHNLPIENLLTPDTLRRTLWTPPETRDPIELLEAVIDQLAGYGARSWQIGLTAGPITEAILQADQPVEEDEEEGAGEEGSAPLEAEPGGGETSSEGGT